MLIIDQSDSAVLYSRHSDVPAPIASITKLMTALVVLDAKQPLDEPLEITQAELICPKAAFHGCPVGTVLTRGDLMHLALMSSENRAAHALGSNYPGGMPAMVSAMNAKAAALGMTSAHFVDPTGLSSENVASPEDLSKLVIAASRNPTIREYSTDTSYTVRVRRHLVEFHNTDNLVRQSHLEHHRAEDRLHRRGRQVPGDGGRDRRSQRGDRAAGFVGQVHARRRCQARQELDGDERHGARAGVHALMTREGWADACSSSPRLLWLIVHPPAIAADRTLSVTIYADDLALVTDQRDIDVKGGRQRIEFQDVSAQIRPETVSLTAGDISIIEQNFDFDLLTPAKLMEKAVGHEITIVRINPANGAETREQAQVLATNGGVVLKIGQRIEVLRDDGLPVRVIFDKVPENLRARPTLSVTIQGARAGIRPATLSYLTPGLGWKADYVALYDEGTGKIDVQGWVTLTNSSGTTYEHARTLLVAGSPSAGRCGAAASIRGMRPSPARRCSNPAPKAAAASGWATTICIRSRSAPPSPICRPSR